MSLKSPVLLTLALIGLSPALNAVETRHVVVDDAWSGATGIHFSGRLTEPRTSPTTRHKQVRTFYHTARMLLTSGEEGTVTWRAADWEWSVRTDDDGYWMLKMNKPLSLAPGWTEITTTPPSSSPAGLLVVDPRNHVGLISDIDDTILKSDVTATMTLLRNSLTVPPGRREAVPGMAALYHRILAQNIAPHASAVFYVSSSPRQLTDNIRTFLTHGGFPRGVLRLKEISEASDNALFNQRDYKLRALTEVLRAYPDVRFSLFGDDGEQDPEIYATLREQFPAQVAGIWIRRVHPNPARAKFADQADLAELLPAPLTDRSLNAP